MNVRCGAFAGTFLLLLAGACASAEDTGSGANVTFTGGFTTGMTTAGDGMDSTTDAGETGDGGMTTGGMDLPSTGTTDSTSTTDGTDSSGMTGGTDPDECAMGTDDCDPLVTCTDEDPGFSCGACPAGYDDVNGDGTQCDDIDECTAGTDDCDALVSCSNTVPGFTCGMCPMGYDDVNGDGTQCDDLDECTLGTDNCDPQVTCTNTAPGFDCGPCPPGTADVNGDGTLCQNLQVTIGLDNLHGYSSTSALGTGSTMSNFRTAITNSGATIQVLSSLDASSINGLTAVFVQQPYTSNLLTSAQVTGLVSYVNAGGNLVIIGDGGSGFNSSNLNLLAQNWGVTYGSSALWGSGQVFSGLTAHPITASVTSFGVDFAPPMTVSAPAQVLATSGGNASLAVATGTGNAGNVVFLSDAWFTNSAGADYNIFSLSNATLLDNIVTYVSQ